MKREKVANSWLALWAGLAVGFVLYIFSPMNMLGPINITELGLWVYFIVAGTISGVVAGLIDKRHALMAALTVGILLFYPRYLSEVIQGNVMGGVNAMPVSWVHSFFDVYFGVIVGSVLGGFGVWLMSRKAAK